MGGKKHTVCFKIKKKKKNLEPSIELRTFENTYDREVGPSSSHLRLYYNIIYYTKHTCARVGTGRAGGHGIPRVLVVNQSTAAAIARVKSKDEQTPDGAIARVGHDLSTGRRSVCHPFGTRTTWGGHVHDGHMRQTSRPATYR